MRNAKGHNSLVFITTLGVYLGLLLVGASPQVMAAAALAKQFDVRDEIEARDDLDNKPDDERSPVALSVQIYLEDVEYFLASLARLRSRGRFDLDRDTFEVAQSTLLPCVDGNRAGLYIPTRFHNTSEASRAAIERFSRGLTYGYSLGDCIANNQFGGSAAVDSRFIFKLDGKEFTVNLGVKKQSPQRAFALQRELEATLKLYATNDVLPVRARISESTTFRTENDQVFVLLRLPRGALDPLIASDAK